LPEDIAYLKSPTGNRRSDNKLKLILARKILPISSHPLSNGGLCIRSGRIIDVGTSKSLLRKYPDARVCNLGNAVLMPGLVNAHTHIELSHLHGRVDFKGGFFEWIKRLIDLRRSNGGSGIEKAARAAIMAAVRSGTTCIGDISATGEAVRPVVKSGIRARVYLEAIGLDVAEADRAFMALKRKVMHFDALPARISPGISPHSTYTVSGALYDKLSSYTSDYMLSIAVHLSENIDEVKYIKGDKSRIDAYHKMLGWDKHENNRAGSPLGYLLEKGFSKRLLAVHAVHVSASDIRRMAGEGVSVAYCPRSNHLLGVGRAPVSRMIGRGVNVAIGTDSLASNIDIDLWEEMRFAHIVGGIDPETLIRMATINGARALGLEDVTGSLEPGKAADIIAVRCNAAKGKEIYKHLLYKTKPDNVLLNMVDGRTLHRADGVAI